VNALDLKLMRDIWRLRGQALAIALVLAAATATFVLSLGVHRSLVKTRDAYYAQYHFAEVFANMTRAPRLVVPRVANLPGVRRVEGGVIQYATLDLPDRDYPVRALINSLEERGNELNRLVLRKGRLPRTEQPGEVIVDEAFAKANGLETGLHFDAIIHGKRQALTVVGIGLAPNYIWAMAPGDLVPDETRFGILWMGRKALEAATDRVEAINTLSLLLEPGARQADVIRKLDAILAPYGGTGAYGREDHPSHEFLDNELMQLEAMTRVIPPIFLVVSALLVNIVLSRLIRTERAEIGLLKAFGYSDWAVGWHYLKFALAVALLAVVLGTGAGIWMGGAMTRLYAEYYRFPFLRYDVTAWVILLAAAQAIGAAALGALGGMRSAVRLAPAVAMSPPPPPVYRAGLAERFGQMAGFAAVGNMILRHIARWPGRSAVTVFGVALSMGLLFATVQFVDSSRSMLDAFFNRAQHQDLTVTFVEARDQRALYELRQIPGVLKVEASRAVSVRLSRGNRSERTAIESSDLDATLSARVDQHGEVVPLPSGGLMLSRQLADRLGVRLGERVHVEQLGERRRQSDQTVTRIVEETVGARAYAGPATLTAITGDAPWAHSAQLRIDPVARDEILTRLRDMPAVLGVTERSAAAAKFEAIIDQNILTILGFYISFASAIAVGVVYNSARILFSERAHELATLRVLGYHRSEVATVLLGELALLVAAALPVGCLVGYWLGQLMAAMFSSDLFRLPFAPERSSYGFAAVIVLAASLVTAAIVARRVMRLDMVRVLKARE